MNRKLFFITTLVVSVIFFVSFEINNNFVSAYFRKKTLIELIESDKLAFFENMISKDNFDLDKMEINKKVIVRTSDFELRFIDIAYITNIILSEQGIDIKLLDSLEKKDILRQNALNVAMHILDGVSRGELSLNQLNYTKLMAYIKNNQYIKPSEIVTKEYNEKVLYFYHILLRAGETINRDIFTDLEFEQAAVKYSWDDLTLKNKGMTYQGVPYTHMIEYFDLKKDFNFELDGIYRFNTKSGHHIIKIKKIKNILMKAGYDRTFFEDSFNRKKYIDKLLLNANYTYYEPRIEF